MEVVLRHSIRTEDGTVRFLVVTGSVGHGCVLSGADGVPSGLRLAGGLPQRLSGSETHDHEPRAFDVALEADVPRLSFRHAGPVPELELWLELTAQTLGNRHQLFKSGRAVVVHEQRVGGVRGPHRRPSVGSSNSDRGETRAEPSTG